MSDADLVRQTLAGRTQAYEELVRRWAGRVTAVCHAKLGCAAAADDLAQEALLRAYRHLQSLSDPAKFGAWLCRIAVHACATWRKAKQRSQILFSVMGPEQNPEDYLAGPEEVEAETDDAERLKQEVAALPEIYRQVVMLYYHEDVTYQDLAEMLGISASAVNARLTKARSMLRDRLTKCRR